jgi:hypothetical protein
MPAYSNIITVPEPEAGSYQPDRPAGKLLQSQALHLREALMLRFKDLEALLAISPTSLKTERELSDYIHRATAVLHTRAPKLKSK